MTGAADLDLVCGFLTAVAESELKLHGRFAPFGVVLDENGRLQMVAGALSEELDSTEKILNFWFTALRQATEGKCHRAAGFCCDVLLMKPASGKKADALQLWVEHSDGTAQTIWFPYGNDHTGKLQLGKPVSKSLAPRIFNHHRVN
jgi:hypothetical protein